MASIRTFCASEELEEWVRMLCATHGLGCIIFRDSEERGVTIAAPDDVKMYADAYRVFLFPSVSPPEQGLTMNDVQARHWGWVDIQPGGLTAIGDDQVLLASRFVGEDYEHEPVHPARFVRWLRRRLKGVIHSGVIGRNLVTGGMSRYRDISYTDRALALLSSGVIWKAALDNRGVFEPLRV